ncbi:hypothetical protein [Kitasatospora sp. NPDC093558]|uniref:allene oxide cyclase barrel-like domain-containing protein n=1 Tax=Kitasatospora sp. NPDC093558 TaxID=3155201 RepID=UPI00342BDEA6
MRPIRTACLVTATALATVLASAPVAIAATDTGSTHPEARDRTFTLIGQLAQSTRFPVNPGGAPAQGDRVAFRSVLFDLDGNRVGETGGTCTTTRVDNGGAEECTVTYDLPGGQLSSQGFIFGFLNPGPAPSFDNGITGGTGEFDRARGMIHADTIGPGPTRRFTIDLDR